MEFNSWRYANTTNHALHNKKLHSLHDTLLVHHVGLEAQDGKHHQRGQDGRDEVDDGHQRRVKVAVVVPLVVAGEGDDAAKAQAQGEEHLRGRLSPDLGLQHLLQLWWHEEQDTVG